MKPKARILWILEIPGTAYEFEFDFQFVNLKCLGLDESKFSISGFKSLKFLVNFNEIPESIQEVFEFF